MITHTTLGPLARGTSVLDVMKNMVLSGSPYALLEGAPLKMVDAVQILRRLSLAENALDVLEILRLNADDLAYEVPVVEDEKAAPLVMMAKEVGAVVMKGGAVVDTLYLLAENKSKLDVSVKGFVDPRPPLVDPLTDIIRALRHSLVYDLQGYVIVGQKRPFGLVNPLKVLRYFTLESTLSQIEMGENAPLEKAIGDLAEPLPSYPSPDTKVADALQTMIDLKSEVLPVVKDRIYYGALKSRTALLALVG